MPNLIVVHVLNYAQQLLIHMLILSVNLVSLIVLLIILLIIDKENVYKIVAIFITLIHKLILLLVSLLAHHLLMLIHIPINVYLPALMDISHIYQITPACNSVHLVTSQIQSHNHASHNAQIVPINMQIH